LTRDKAQTAFIASTAKLYHALPRKQEVSVMVNGLLETGQAARVLEVSPFRVRQLADAGALPVAGRTAAGRRLFDPAAVEQLRRERERARRGRENKRAQGLN
jgi:hypothetical protein